VPVPVPGWVVFTKLKAELITLAQPVPVPSRWIHMVGTTAGREVGHILLPVRDFPCPTISLSIGGVGTTAGRAGSYASPALPETACGPQDRSVDS
jgi:hypothetical protein